ncbi:hypothetical protein [Sphingomonas sp. 3-13AW]|uniref:hypothetical protein n=1 Tax=Sphingomonas sp. 3-13AW TaxID=3050450 RepID=UPI003BB80076
MIKKMVLALLPVAVLAGCGDGAEQKKAPDAPKEKGLPLDDVSKLPENAQKGANAEVMRMRKVAGRWQSQPGILPSADQWLVLDISNDKKFTLDVRGKSPDAKLDAVYVEVQGDISWAPDGLVQAKGKGAKEPIKGFDAWTGSFPSAGKMSVRGSDGKAYELSYRGL